MSHTGFRLVPTSMTLNDLEERNSFYFAFFSPNSIALHADYVEVVEDIPIMSVKYCLSVPVFHFWPKLTHPAARSLAIAEHFVFFSYCICHIDFSFRASEQSSIWRVYKFYLVLYCTVNPFVYIHD